MEVPLVPSLVLPLAFPAVAGDQVALHPVKAAVADHQDPIPQEVAAAVAAAARLHPSPAAMVVVEEELPYSAVTAAEEVRLVLVISVAAQAF